MKFNFLFLMAITMVILASQAVKAEGIIVKEMCAGDLGSPPKDKENAESICPKICATPPLTWVAPGYWKPRGKPGIFSSGDQAAKVCQEQELSGRSVCSCTFHDVNETQDICAGLLGSNEEAQKKCPDFCKNAPRVQEFGGRFSGRWKSDKENAGEHYAYDICTKAGWAKGTGRSVCTCQFGFDS